jgi:putative aldouronate transport system permease protein
MKARAGDEQALYIRKKRNILQDIFKNPFSYLILLPAFLYTLTFGYLTLPYILIAFQSFSYQTDLASIFRGSWIGIENFKFFFATSSAWTVTRNTIVLNLLFLFFTTIAALAVSIMLNELRNKYFVKVSQSLMLLPNFLSWMVVSYILYALLATDNGVLNRSLEFFGKSPVAWYSNAKSWPFILTAMRVWKGTGMSAVVYLAAIAGIDSELYEAAVIDGAGRWKMMRLITLPLLLPMVCIMTIMSLGGIFRGDFGMIYAIIRDNGILYSTTDVIDTYVYRALRKIGDPTQTMAIGLYQAAFGFIFVFGSNWVTKRVFRDGALF